MVGWDGGQITNPYRCYACTIVLPARPRPDKRRPPAKRYITIIIPESIITKHQAGSPSRTRTTPPPPPIPPTARPSLLLERRVLIKGSKPATNTISATDRGENMLPFFVLFWLLLLLLFVVAFTPTLVLGSVLTDDSYACWRDRVRVSPTSTRRRL